MGPLGRFGPPLALMALIFFLSAQEGLNSGLGLIDTIGRKFVHMGEFGLLFVLWWRALEWRRVGIAAAVALAYAASDEYHQTFVAGRSGHPRDWAIDALGIALAWALVTWRRTARGEERGRAGDRPA